MGAADKKRERAEDAARPCFNDLPYRMVIFEKLSPQGVPLYRVGGSVASACKARKALQEAFRLHGGSCFYCKKKLDEETMTIDHAEPAGAGGKDGIQNLLIACRPCNQGKGAKAIELYNPEAGREWLTALLKQVQDRLNRLQP